MSATLYEIIAEHERLEQMLEESGGELTPEIEAFAADLGLKERNKVDNLGRFIRETEARETAVKAERDNLAARAVTLGNKVKSLKRLCDLYLTARGMTKAEGEVFVIARQKNGGKPPIVLAEDVVAKLAAGVPVPDILPPVFVRTRTEHSVNNDALREALERGDESAATVAVIGEPGHHIRVR